ncbi:uncharacterized protein MYCFIDRAFT_198767 [Pseudocercospora fijiensis CIRAD86]|uniref:F-box domain-containing protein n=1 Tax=Pseudocercospora fijiensis (strain CIRAD86) TaxID=383855 RepID=M2YS65_PSEFD|nr:uncharacterized protein MYCFIDRAFT_198767 [Pseudocercospora fijiensis CIRAD86]EME80580.1 hypothetical protein MYCFIDRAFT_198767 [Pseudocercospora fijiensis CIRAD86]
MDSRPQAERDAARDAVRGQVFRTVELLEMILSNIADPYEVLLLRAVGRNFRDTIDGSVSLTGSFIFAQTQSATIPGPSLLESFYEDNTHSFDGPANAAAGLYNRHFLDFGCFGPVGRNLPYRYETKDGILTLPNMELDYDEISQEGSLSVSFAAVPKSLDLGLLACMFFTSHPIPVIKLKFQNPDYDPLALRKDPDSWKHVEITLENPRLGEVLDMCWLLLAIVSILRKRLARQDAKEALRELRREEKEEWQRWGGGDEEDSVEEAEEAEEVEEVEPCLWRGVVY